jgi:hypothetical protein
MESGDHFKNGASPKNLMSRKKSSMLSVFVLMIFVLGIAGCSILYDGLSTGLDSLSNSYSGSSSSGYRSSGYSSSGSSSSSSTPAKADDCNYSYSQQQDGDWWRPVFTRKPCSRSLKITYKVHFSDGSSDQSRSVYFMSSSFSQTQRGSERYNKPGSIKIVKEDWGD